MVELLKSDEIKGFSSLLNMCFPVNAGGQFLDDFPVWDPAQKCQKVKRYGIIQDGQIVACSAVRIAELKNGSASPIRVALIGGVATHPKCRGAGFASTLVQEAIRWAAKEEASIAMLWGSEHKLYQRLGFELCGEQIRVSLSELDAAHLLGRTSSPVHKGWHPGIFDLLKDRPDGLKLTEDDRTWVQAHKNVDWYYAQAAGRPVAYLAYGRGIDLNGIVHEWGGETTALFELFHEIYRVNASSEILGCPKYFEKLGIPIQKNRIEFLCLAKNFEPSRLLPSPLWIWGLDAA